MIHNWRSKKTQLLTWFVNLESSWDCYATLCQIKHFLKMTNRFTQITNLIHCFFFKNLKFAQFWGLNNRYYHLSLTQDSKLDALVESFYYVKNLSNNLSNENKWYYRNSSFWHFNSGFVLKTTKLPTC